ncbi:aromatic-ring-hydroxylating dioxygenase beta subunit [Sulfolobus islandicus L.S.2.15]|uniref:Aromatic-ring-hydroxylating dioxygenase beta subunit n=1 Tax=Saccharolobus islandicus (strain L.S.2.15 / Lassen \|nr:aromatic-ring-hydroxylating dioxygenase subunit beta [Sulfolobus islandicus]ACP34809.1 aromatic-ring-hydroxylating dioxygenase beta subunit [Sulfolobus islandicus L.S.2.15]
MNLQELFYNIYNFEIMEAELLDAEEYDKWLTLLDDDYEYYVMEGDNRQGKKLDFGNRKFLFSADKNKWKLFIDRLFSSYGWSYQYAQTKTRRIIGNIRIVDLKGNNIVHVASNVLVLRFNAEDIKEFPTLISGKREDTLRIYRDNEIKIVRRIVYLDSTSYPSYNLYFPL